jgi:hypothetical protein
MISREYATSSKFAQETGGLNTISSCKCSEETSLFFLPLSETDMIHVTGDQTNVLQKRKRRNKKEKKKRRTRRNSNFISFRFFFFFSFSLSLSLSLSHPSSTLIITAITINKGETHNLFSLFLFGDDNG